MPAERNQHERQDDDQEPLEQIGPGRRHQSADKTVEDEHHRHGHHDFVDAGGGARRLTDDLAGAFEQAAGFDDEEAHGKHDVDRAHERAVSIPGKLRHRRSADAPEHRRHHPVERGDEQVLPLVPDGGGAEAVDGAGERHRHLRMGADAEALADHHPRTEFPVAEKVLAAAPNAVADDQPDGGDDNEVDDQDGPIEA